MSVRGGQQRADEDGYRRWLIFFGVISGGAALVTAAQPARPGPSTAVAAAIVIAIQVGYWSVAHPARAGAHANGWRAWLFAGVALVGFPIAVTLNGWAALALLAITPEVFLLLTLRPAAGVTVALNLAPLGLRLVAHPVGGLDLVQMLGRAAFVIALSLFYADRIGAILRQSRERQRLIEGLHEREAEITALSAARGAEQERTRIAREMHDTLAQGFTSIITLGHAAQGELDTNVAAARRHVELITATAQENLTESRRIIAALTPLRLADHSLPQALARVVTAFSDETGLDAAVEVRGMTRAASAAAEVVALRVVQEALSNARKHARAEHVAVALEYAPSALTVEISDDGAGFDPAAPTTGYGLEGMRSRVLESGGTIRVASRPGAGTIIHASVPTGSLP